MALHPLIADALRRSGEELPASGKLILSCGSIIECSIESKDAEQKDARGKMDRAAAGLKSLGLSVVRGDFAYKGTAGTETMQLSVGGVPIGAVTVRTFALSDNAMLVGFKAATPGAIQGALKSAISG